MWYDSIFLGNHESKPYYLPIKIGILRNTKLLKNDEDLSYLLYTGFTIYESNRAIMCGPNDMDDSHGSKNYIAGLRATYGGSGIEYRIFGEFDIDNLLNDGLISLSDQKFGFEWINKLFETKFLEYITNWKTQYSPLLSLLTNMQQNFSEPEKWNITKMGKMTLKNTYANSLNFFYDEDLTTLTKESNQNFSYSYINPKTNQKGKIKIFHIDSNYDSKNFYNLKKINETDFEIILNIFHPIWKPLVTGSNITKTSFISSLHRLAFLFTCVDDINNGSADLINELANISFEQENAK